MGNYNFGNRDKKSNSDSMFRALTQDVLKSIKEDDIDFIYPKKMVDKKDIGAICSDLNLSIVTKLRYNEEAMIKLQTLLKFLYNKNINPKNNKIWITYWQRYGLTGISQRIETLRDMGRLGAMGSPDRKDNQHTGKDFNARKW